LEEVRTESKIMIMKIVSKMALTRVEEETLKVIQASS
jgi:hypothetical protein